MQTSDANTELDAKPNVVICGIHKRFKNNLEWTKNIFLNFPLFEYPLVCGINFLSFTGSILNIPAISEETLHARSPNEHSRTHCGIYL